MAAEFKLKTGRDWKIPRPARYSNDLEDKQEPKMEEIFFTDEISGRKVLQHVEHAPKKAKQLDSRSSAAPAAASASSSSSSTPAAASTTPSAAQQPSPPSAERAAPVQAGAGKSHSWSRPKENSVFSGEFGAPVAKDSWNPPSSDSYKPAAAATEEQHDAKFGQERGDSTTISHGWHRKRASDTISRGA